MTKFVDFITEYHVIFNIASIILILALIGYFVDKKNKKAKAYKIDANNNEKVITDIPVNTNMSLQQFVNENKSVNKNENNNS